MNRPTFEDTYPKYEFSELVRVGLAIAAWILRLAHRAQARRPEAAPPAAGNALHAN